MSNILSFFKYMKLLAFIIIRNIKWLAVLCFRGTPRPWDILNFKMILSARSAGLDLKENSIHKQLILDGLREQKSTQIMKEFIKPDDVILELGANIGYYVLIESTILSDKGYIYAVEPGPENFELLKKNIDLNKVRNIEISNIAISNQKSKAKLYIGRACNLHSLIDSSNTPDARYVMVETDTVDNFLKGKNPITFLRMDIEGYEATVIEAMEETLKSPVLKRMFIEIHPHRITDNNKLQYLFRKIKDNHFQIKYAVSHDNWQREILGHCKVETISIDELSHDRRVLERKNAFEVFFEKNP